HFDVISHLDPGLEKAIDQAQQRRIGHVLLEPAHQSVMIDSIKGNSHTLPITRNFLQASPSFARTILS
ncbi:MAG: hypothetical protein WCA12_20935, partial [Burkholderiales bacterium]